MLTFNSRFDATRADLVIVFVEQGSCTMEVYRMGMSRVKGLCPYASLSDLPDLESCSIANKGAGSMERANAGVSSSSQQPELGIMEEVVVSLETVLSASLVDPQHPFVSAFEVVVEEISWLVGLRELQHPPGLVGDTMAGATTSSFSFDEPQHPFTLVAG